MTVRHTVMVVDDDSNILDFLVKVLGNDYFVISTDSGSQALNLLRNNDPDLVVSDIMMADIDGIELCRRIKNDISTSHIPVILLTARTGVSSKIEGLECGADAYIEKPFSPDQLKAQISSLLRTRDEIRRLYAGKFMTEFDTGSQQNRLDEEFILKCRDVIIAHMRNPDLSVGLLARELAMGRTLIFRKLKAVTGLTPNDFMKLIRLNEAKRMIIKADTALPKSDFLPVSVRRPISPNVLPSSSGFFRRNSSKSRTPERSSQGQNEPFLNSRGLRADFIVKVNDIFQHGIPDSVILH